MKLICNGCAKWHDDPCILDVGNEQTVSDKRMRCPFKSAEGDLRYCKWEKYEDGEVAKLPKLTAEVFDRHDCPEWAKWAAVSISGNGVYFDSKPHLNLKDVTWDGVKKWEFIYSKTGIVFQWDYTDWKNSLVERPAKLPDWCKEGEWVYLCNGTYSRIVSINDCHVNLENGISVGKNSIHEEMVSAILRPYNAEEMKALVGKVVKKGQRLYLVTAYFEEQQSIIIGSLSSALLNAELLIGNNITIDGKPCGVLEHFEEGEWVK